MRGHSDWLNVFELVSVIKSEPLPQLFFLLADTVKIVQQKQSIFCFMRNDTREPNVRQVDNIIGEIFGTQQSDSKLKFEPNCERE